MRSEMLSAQETSFSGWALNNTDYLTVYVENGRITRIEKKQPGKRDPQQSYIAPGLIDAQVNGYASVSFSEDGLTPEGIRKVCDSMAAEGTTTFLPTLITGPPDLTRNNLRILAGVLKDPRYAHVMPGIFMEGPYISPIDGFRGAHNEDWVRLPDWEEFMTLYKASGEKIIQVGLAPELKGAMDFISKLQQAGVAVSLAHHNATTAQIGEAVERGAFLSTHLGNGCANMIPRHDNPIWPQLANHRLTASLIADGFHLTREELITFYKAKGPDRIILVSDVTELAGMPPGQYDWNGKNIVMTHDGRLVYPEQEVLAGASFSLRYGIMNMMRLADCSLEEAFRLATVNPARLYGLDDRGELTPGKRADLIIFSIRDDKMIVHRTVVRGETVFSDQ